MPPDAPSELTPEQDWDALHRPFRPRRARKVAAVTAVAQFVVLFVIAFLLPGEPPIAFRWYDRGGVIAVGAIVAWFLWRYVRLSAVPSSEGLVVRNLLLGRTVTWSQILTVRMGNGAPWVTLQISDGDELAVMAVQRADGDYGRAEADRLATLVAAHQR